MKKETSEACADRNRREGEPLLSASQLSVHAGSRALVRDVQFEVQRGEVFGIIGPSGAGKSTLLRALNRLAELVPGLRVSGDVRLNGASIYDASVDVNALRARIGMLFQQPVIFPASVADNVVFGARRAKRRTRAELDELTESALREAALWDEMKDRLKTPATSLSVGQQQRLCLARALAMRSEVILMDEPTSALDPKATQAIEELILRLRERHTIVLVTHNVGQARRIADWLACVCVRDGAGTLVESACCEEVLENPQCREVIEYLEHAR